MFENETRSNPEYQKSPQEMAAGTIRKFDSLEANGITPESYASEGKVKNVFERLKQETE